MIYSVKDLGDVLIVKGNSPSYLKNTRPQIQTPAWLASLSFYARFYNPGIYDAPHCLYFCLLIF